MKLIDILPNPENPRVLRDEKFAKLKQSIQDFPKMMSLRPIVIDNMGMILGGNMRYRALQELGFKEIPETWVKRAEELTAEEKRRFIIADNVGFGEWDWDELANNWDVEELGEWGLDVPNFEDEVLEAKEDDFNVPDGGIDTDIVLGDLFEIGEHRLLCGDSTQTDTFQKLFQNELADLVVTDPPYNVDYTGKTKDSLKIENDNKDDQSFYQFLYDFYTALGAYTKPGGAWYIWHASSEIVNFAKAFKDAGFLLKQQLIWVKNSLVMGRQDYHWKHEPCLYGWKDGAAHGWYSDRKQTTVLNFDRPNRNAEHPTMKPVELFAYQIANSSKSGDIVADAFGGSGTTMVACHQMNRRARIVEYDPKYCQVIVDRMLKLDPDLVVLKNGQPYVNYVKNT
jgi:site-specific DNA-methyltransferase (adenine-specific)